MECQSIKRSPPNSIYPLFDKTSESEIPRINVPKPPIAGTTTQTVLRIDSHWTSEEIWLSQSPKVQTIRITGPEEYLPVDTEMRPYFKKGSISEDHLVYRRVVELKKVTEVPGKEIRTVDVETLRNRLKTGTEINLLAEPEVKTSRRHPFIYRAKYRL